MHIINYKSYLWCKFNCYLELLWDYFIKIKHEEVLTFNFYKDNLVHEC
ncbi:hypothetical protein SAMN06272738_6193 [Bacillus sp. JKS001846]|nr:hypothetical protein SAMN06272738_6193 [Bacillus sp. JKS001846]